MKHLIKTVIGLSIIALSAVLISCPAVTGNGTPGGIGPDTVPAVPSETPIERALSELAVSPIAVFSETTKVNLPVTTSVPDVTITWEALPTGYINDEESSPDFGKILKREPEAAEITLTATATKDGETKTKTFKVVIHPSTVEPTATQLADSLSIPAAFSKEIVLPKNVDGYPSADITWTSSDNKIVEVKTDGSGIKGIAGYDIVDNPLTLTAKVNYKGNTATKPFSVTVKHVVEAKRENTFQKEITTYTFTGSEVIIITVDKATQEMKRGFKYVYTDVQTAADNTKTALFTQTQEYRNSKWMTAQEIVEERKNSVKRALTELQKLEGKNPLTLSDFIPYIEILTGQTFPDTLTGEALFNAVKNFIDLNKTYPEFNGLSEQQKTALLKGKVMNLKRQNEGYLNYLSQNGAASAFSPPRRYIYRFEKYGAPGNEQIYFQTNEPYDGSKPWYRQSGGYHFSDYSSSGGAIQNIWLSIGQRRQNVYEAFINISRMNKNYKGTVPYTPDTTTITVTLEENGQPGQTLTFEATGIDVFADGTMTAQIKIDGEQKSYTLKFNGYSLRS